MRSLDAIFDLLAAKRRRIALYVLSRRGGPVALADLAEAVAATEQTPPERVEVSLRHVHLPKLADAGVADYDPDAGTARLAEHSDRFRRYLRTAAEDERRFAGTAFGASAESRR